MCFFHKSRITKFKKKSLRFILSTFPVLIMIGIMAVLYNYSKDLDEGLKLSLSALLGAMASYVFVQYAEYLKGIKQVENRHSGALHSLDLILNDLLDWLSNVEFNMNTHTEIVERDLVGNTLTHDTSSSRPPVLIRLEIIDAINNIPLKNKLRSINMALERLGTDLNSMYSSHRFAVDASFSGNMKPKVYKTVILPSHLKKVEILKKFRGKLVVDTKDSIAVVRVLKNDNRGLSSAVRRLLIEQTDPADFENLKTQQLHILEDQIKDVRNKSRNEIRNLEQRG